MAGEIFVHACHILKRAETCLVASQNPQHKKVVSFNPHPRLQKNLQVYRRRGPHGPQKQSSAV